MSLKMEIAGETHELNVVARRPQLVVRLDGRLHSIADGGMADGVRTITIDGVAVAFAAVQDGTSVHLHVDGRVVRVDFPDPRDAAAAGGAGASDIVAPMPGTVLCILRNQGDAVAAGDVVLTIESMKLQMNLVAPRDGIVARVAVGAEATFNKGDTLVMIEAEDRD